MKIKRSVLERIIKEEITAEFARLLEAPKDDKGSKAPDVVDAEDEKKAGEKAGTEKPDSSKNAKPTPKSPKPSQNQADAAPVGDLPVSDEPEADAELEQDVAGEEDAEEVTGGKIADMITGKTVQSVTSEPKSKILPGATEITLTFREVPDPLRILVTKTGTVKFHMKGLHNSL